MRAFLRTSRIPVLIAIAAIGIGIAARLRFRSNWDAPQVADARIEFPESVDLGEHELGSYAESLVEVRNVGSKQLVVDRVRTNCSCAGLEQRQNGVFERISRVVIEPGQACELRVRVMVNGVPHGGQMRNVIEFDTNDPRQPVGRIIAVVTHVSRGVHTVPSSLVIAPVPVGATVRKTVEVWDRSLVRRVVSRVVSSDPERVAARLLPFEASDMGSTSPRDGMAIGRVEVVLDTRRPGDIQATVYIELAGGESTRGEFLVTGSVAAPFEFAPSLIALPRASAAGPIFSADCVCRAASGDPVSIEVVRAPDDVAIDIVTSPGTTGSFRVRWNPGPVQAGRRDVIRIRAVAGGLQEQVELPLLLLGKKADP